MLRPTWLVILALAAGACGGRAVPPGSDDSGVRDGAVGDALHRDGPTDGPYLPDGLNAFCTADEHCAVAVRTDNCCEAAYPEKLWTIDTDPCLEYWFAYGSVPIPQQCMDKWDPQCAYIDCMPAPPPSRLARCDQGVCEFAIECNQVSECVVVTDVRQCCPCPMVVPAKLLEVDPCLVKYPQGGTPPQTCYPQACPAMPCQVCETPAANCLQQTCQGILPH